MNDFNRFSDAMSCPVVRTTYLALLLKSQKRFHLIGPDVCIRGLVERSTLLALNSYVWLRVKSSGYVIRRVQMQNIVQYIVVHYNDPISLKGSMRFK
jgi:hypothetical protein